MSEQKIVVPEGMLKAAHIAVENGNYFFGQLSVTKTALEAALKWLAENPIVPTDEQIEQMCRDFHNRYREPPIGFTQSHYLVVEWQRKMFLTPDPEIPAQVVDMVNRLDSECNYTAEFVEARIVEAYNRGLSRREDANRGGSRSK